ncbi:hypothetical protein CHS0354_031017 [Potamilus streckersoni]|uniref:Uncharacterized protein n=1 Tax=Potamilus streckersoni TaxID=2493646 RepID=A0AAE0TCU9_9BIVA|nr:hypothetical protein CHS0354_031017 [Potamilus streckersoni]
MEAAVTRLMSNTVVTRVQALSSTASSNLMAMQGPYLGCSKVQAGWLGLPSRYQDAVNVLELCIAAKSSLDWRAGETYLNWKITPIHNGISELAMSLHKVT